jgi:glyoxylase I family protein
MKLARMEHLGINVGDFEKSLVFYRDILGLKQLETVKYPDYSITYMELPDRGRLELFDYCGRSPAALPVEDTRIGYRHIAFEVDDVAAWERRLREKGVKIVMATLDMPELGSRGLLCEDPDGTVIELCSKL